MINKYNHQSRIVRNEIEKKKVVTGGKGKGYVKSSLQKRTMDWLDTLKTNPFKETLS